MLHELPESTNMTSNSISVSQRESITEQGYLQAPTWGEVAHLPLIDEDTFARQPRAAYEVALLAVGESVYRPEAFLAARQLRYAKYTELGWLSKDVRDTDGGEHDEYDAYAAQFGVMKNTPYGSRMIATSRLIVRNGTLLPVEKDYPEVYGTNPVQPGETEASRLISDSKNKKERALATFALERAMVGWGIRNDHTVAHAMVEDYLLRRFDETRLPYTKMSSDFKEIEEYANTKNMAIRVDAFEVVKKVRITQVGIPLATSLFFCGIQKTQGLGFYGKSLIRRFPDERA